MPDDASLVTPAQRLQTNPCNLCPRLCGARRDEGATGICGAGNNLLVARAALHFWEEPPISGTTGSGTVFFTGCPLRCVYCQNGDLAAAQVGWEVSVERLARICGELESSGALNINFVTPTHYSLQIRDAVAMARKQGMRLPIVWNTSGYERVETIAALEDTVNVYLTDFKYADPLLAKRYSQAPDYPDAALAAIEEMVRNAGEPRFDHYHGQLRLIGGVIVRHLVLPGATENSLQALDLLVQRFGNSVAYSIMNQYTPVTTASVFRAFPELNATVSSEEYETVLDHADSLGLEDYFWQDGPAAKESFIPEWNGEGVFPQNEA